MSEATFIEAVNNLAVTGREPSETQIQRLRDYAAANPDVREKLTPEGQAWFDANLT